MERDARLHHSLPLHKLQGPQYSSPPPPSGVPHRAPKWRETDIPFPESSYIRLSKSLANEPTSRFPNGAPTERDAHLRLVIPYRSIETIYPSRFQGSGI
jgi:hypothetical protein